MRIMLHDRSIISILSIHIHREPFFTTSSKTCYWPLLLVVVLLVVLAPDHMILGHDPLSMVLNGTWGTNLTRRATMALLLLQ